MTREEALDRMKRLDLNSVDREALYTIIPELRGSDDERIRSCIGLALTDVNEQRFKDFGITLKDCLSWLEKQKEQKPVDYDHEMWKNCEANFEGGKKEVIEHPEKYGLQKHVEWSKEDKTMLNNLIWAVHMKSISPLDEMDDRGNYERYEKFLTSLPERFGLKPKQEWSEEDEILRVRTINRLETLNFHGIPGKEIRESVDWLRSLRPSWKPSKEEMKAFRRCIEDLQARAEAAVGGWDNFNVMIRLYEELKKL